MLRLQPSLRRQLEAHVLAFADMLMAWQLPLKRAELLESAHTELIVAPDVSHPILANMVPSPLGDYLVLYIDDSPDMSWIGVARTCAVCSYVNEPNLEFCSSCGGHLQVERCTVCRLPIRGGRVLYHRECMQLTRTRTVAHMLSLHACNPRALLESAKGLDLCYGMWLLLPRSVVLSGTFLP